MDQTLTTDHHPERRQLVPNEVLGMLLFVAVEAMMFAGLISAFMIVKSGAPIWPPPGQPRLPVEATAFNTAALLASGGVLWVANRKHAEDPWSAERPLLVSMLLGAFFVLFQGYEWVQLLAEGLTMTSSQLGAFFYLMVGMHALHAVVAIGGLFYVYQKLRRGTLSEGTFLAAQIFWYFVVGLWPILYWRVYM